MLKALLGFWLRVDLVKKNGPQVRLSFVKKGTVGGDTKMESSEECTARQADSQRMNSIT